jgi:hypothetical protein
MIYKVSFVVQGGSHPGGIQNLDERPTVGDVLTLSDREFEIIEVMELVPPRGDYAYLHATCRPADKGRPADKKRPADKGRPTTKKGAEQDGNNS